MDESNYITLNPEDDTSLIKNTSFEDYTDILASRLVDTALTFAGLDTQNVSDTNPQIMSQQIPGTMLPITTSSTVFETSTTELAIRLTATILLLLLSLVGGFANAAVLMVFVRRPALRNRSNRFVMNLLAINLLSCILLLPLAATDLLVQNTIICIIGEAVTAGICASSALGVLLVAADQYCAVLKPLQYHATRSISSKHLAAAFMISTWLAGLICSFLSIIDLTPKNALWNSCKYTIFELNINFRIYFSLFYILFIFIIPVSTLCWLYGCIYTEAHKNSKRARRNGSTHECNENNSVNIQPLLSVSSPHTNRIVSSLKHRISNASLFKYREEARAARISFLVIFMSIICWSPYCILLILKTLFLINIKQYFLTCSIALLASTSLVSPALFAYRSRRLQREVKKLILCQSKNYSLPSSNFLTRNKWRKRAALAAVAAATLVNANENNKSHPPPTCVTIEKDEVTSSDMVTVNIVNPADTSRSSFSSGTTQGTSTDIE